MPVGLSLVMQDNMVVQGGVRLSMATSERMSNSINPQNRYIHSAGVKLGDRTIDSSGERERRSSVSAGRNH